MTQMNVREPREAALSEQNGGYRYAVLSMPERTARSGAEVACAKNAFFIVFVMTS